MEGADHGAIKVLGVAIVTAFVRDFSFYRSLRVLVLPLTIGAIIYRAIKTPEQEPLLTWLVTSLIAGQSPTVTLVIKDILGLIVLDFFVRLVRQARRLTWREVKANSGDGFFNLVKHLPPVQKQLQGEAEKLEQSLEHSLRPDGTVDPTRVLPAKGRPQGEIIAQMKAFCVKEEPKWRDGYVSGAVYSGEASLLELMGQASALYSVSNPLHPDLWPSLMKFEAEICSMVSNLVSGGTAGVVGSITSGGTESILLAAKTHRDWYRAEKGVTEPEIVACVSAHAAIDKACNLMGIRLVKIPMNPRTFELDVAAMERAITSNTVMLYSSAPTFAQGVIDPIAAVARLGRKYGVGVHVDCCLGGFILPFAKKLGYSVPDFDFSLPGVTSMSVDTHKYGYASKGTSVVVYRSKELRHYQYFCFPNWTGGLYVTPTVAGSRPGALSAACWAAMVHTGEDGYLKRAKEILETARTIADGVRAIPGLTVQGKAEAMIVCVGSEELNIYDVGDYMTKKGWSLNSLQDPAGLHLCCTYRTVGRSQAFLDDLKQAVADVHESMAKDGGKKKTGNAAIYGMASSLPAGPIKMMLCTYTDVVLKA